MYICAIVFIYILGDCVLARLMRYIEQTID